VKAVTIVDGLVAPLDRANIDTDAIIPKQFLKSVQRSGFGPNLFDEWRYLDRGEPGQDCSARPLNPQFILNEPRYHGASVLVTRDNFGCGSSREHAPWALMDYGFRALIAPSFADIFYGNCLRNGLLAIRLPSMTVEVIFRRVADTPAYRLHVDLPRQTVTAPDGTPYSFEIDAFRKQCLVEGLDDIEITLRHAEQIRTYESARRVREPWVFE
jgi:3-isopropylmalate/(R)-2-methylmalate dehydratase small subunit